MKRLVTGIALLLFAGMALSACGSSPDLGQGGSTKTPADAAPTPTSQGGAASTPASTAASTPASSSTPQSPPAGTYPKMGHAADYSWIAGKVSFTSIQGGCIYVRTEELPTADPAPTLGAGGMIVGTAVSGSESLPLRDITPSPPGPAIQEPIGPSFVPGGNGWDSSKVQDGDYMVLFGHVAGPGEPREMCPGGTPYVSDTMQRNP